MTKTFIQQSKDYARIEKAIHFLSENFHLSPNLQEVAAHLHMSEYHFQRMFQRWAGISPKKFLQYLTKEYAKNLLKDSNILDASYASGLSSPSRLHDLFVNLEAMSPGEYKHKAQGMLIEYGFHPSPFGMCFIAVTNRGICNLSFIDQINRNSFLEDFRRWWKNALFKQNQQKTGRLLKNIFASRRLKSSSIKVLCKGTNFQVKVWEALLKIPPGRLTSYGAIAKNIGHPKAVRAVGTAVGKNPMAYLIPCHRVIREQGLLGGYRWGITRKKAILGLEGARFNDGA